MVCLFWLFSGLLVCVVGLWLIVSWALSVLEMRVWG